MKRFFGILFVLFICIGTLWLFSHKITPNNFLSSPLTHPTNSPQKTITHSLFVPYWSLSNGKVSNPADTYIYFGVSANTSGINTSDNGYQHLNQFTQSVPANKQTLLTLRMIDSESDFTILSDKRMQQTIISQTVSLSQTNHFSGVVLDLELHALPFDSLLKQINTFVISLHQQLHEQNKSLFVTIYGDTYYRARPFDVKTIGQNSDGIMLMAYDFSKVAGDPGPNFPLSGKDTYGYDLAQMITDFSKEVPVDKLTIISGLYGYDWTIDDKGHTIGSGQAITLAQIQHKFFPTCSFVSCQVIRDPLSTETKITYTASDHTKHVVWFEDMDSMQKKDDFAKQQGITSFSTWAYSYF